MITLGLWSNPSLFVGYGALQMRINSVPRKLCELTNLLNQAFMLLNNVYVTIKFCSGNYLSLK